MARLSGAMGIFVLTALLLAGAAVNAQTRTESLRWTHADPTNTVGYKVYFGGASRSYTQQVDVGVPPIVSTIYAVNVSVPASGSVYFAVTAYDAQGNESPFSNEIVRTTTSDGGTTTTPPPPSGTASSAIVGFVLRDARTQAALDSDFTSGDQINVATQSCTSIEVVGNTYLSKLNQPGSVQTVFDGQNSACNNAPLTHENNPPYAWETESDCAPSLTTVGSHQLTAIPYDGDDCSGQAGTPVSVTFDVIDSSSGGGSSDASVGQPGRPLLIQ
jgi:sorbitol-specific phosphotransferase system component IIA